LAKLFHWALGVYVGPMEVREQEVGGVLQKSVVHIEKCRYLETSKCAGMCINLCKNPCQSFFKDQLGMPLTMNPNFEDGSCEMIFGVPPPPFEDDPASAAPCNAACPAARAPGGDLPCKHLV